MRVWLALVVLGLGLRACGLREVHAWACVGKSTLVTLLAHAALLSQDDAWAVSLLHAAGEFFAAFEAYDLVHMSIVGTATPTYVLHHVFHGSLCAYGVVCWDSADYVVPTAVLMAQETSSILLNARPLLSQHLHHLSFSSSSSSSSLRQCFAVLFFAYRILGMGLTLALVPIHDPVLRLCMLVSWGMQLAWARKVWRYLPWGETRKHAVS